MLTHRPAQPCCKPTTTNSCTSPEAQASLSQQILLTLLSKCILNSIRTHRFCPVQDSWVKGQVGTETQRELRRDILFFSFFWRTFKISSLNNFQICYTVLLTIAAVLETFSTTHQGMWLAAGLSHLSPLPLLPRSKLWSSLTWIRTIAPVFHASMSLPSV